MQDDEAWLALREGRERRDLRVLELVLAARGIDSRIDWRQGIFRLLVAEEDAAAASRELASYERENAVAPLPRAPARIDSGWWGVCIYLGAIWLVLALERTSAFGWDWRRLGRLQVGAVADGEFWRLATALTLHADLGHIVANSVFGGLFGLLAGRYLGSGLAWLCIVVGGTLGNALNALLRADYFSSIGASTATFAATGIYAAFMWRSGHFRARPWQRGAAPIFAAVALFAYLGIGDDNTDVIAHAAGLACGLLLGLWVAYARLHLAGPQAQRFFGAVAAAWMLGAWLLAY